MRLRSLAKIISRVPPNAKNQYELLFFIYDIKHFTHQTYFLVVATLSVGKMVHSDIEMNYIQKKPGV